MKKTALWEIILLISFMFLGCTGGDGTDGTDGLSGVDGADGAEGVDGMDGVVSDGSGWLELSDEEIAAIKARDGVTECVGCHDAATPLMVNDFVHSPMGALHDVNCVDCHADNTDGLVAGVEGHRKLPRPETCAACHPKEYEGHRANRHSIASIRNYECGRFDDFPMDMIEEGDGYHFTAAEVLQLQDFMNSSQNGPGDNENPTAIAKCMQCHNVENRCDSCHTRHRFSTVEARDPAACGTCHMGPDHPQIEMYEYSKHGVMHGVEGDTNRVPVCVDCHMPYNDKILDRPVDDDGKAYTDHNLAATSAYGPVGGGTTRKGFVSDNGRVKFVSKDLGETSHDELWYDWADGKVYTDATGTTVVFEDIYLMSVSDEDADGKHDYKVAQPADDAGTLTSARNLMLEVCTKCHAHNFAQERLLVADLIHENTKATQGEGLDMVEALAAAEIGPYSVMRPDNLETGNINFDANMKVRNLTTLEHEYFNVMKYDQVKTWKGAYHFNPDYTHWYGWTEMNLTLGDMGNIATDQVLLDLFVRGETFPADPSANLWDLGLYQGVIFEQASMENYYDRFPGPNDMNVDWFDATGAYVGEDVDGTPDCEQDMDIDQDGTIDLYYIGPCGTFNTASDGSGTAVKFQ